MFFVLIKIFFCYNERMKNLFKNWSLFELILLFASPLVVVAFAVGFKSDVLTTITAIVGILCALF